MHGMSPVVSEIKKYEDLYGSWC